MEKLLFEIGTEEIPAKFMPAILNQLKAMAEKKMQELRIPFGKVVVYGTPRRMAFLAEDVSETQEDITTESKGPSVKIAFGADGAPSKAAQGFARGQKVNVEDLVVRDGYVYAIKQLAGQKVEELLPSMLDDIIHSLSFPKTMHWANYDFRFVRPIHWLVALLGSKVIPVEITDVKSGNKSRGHRFLCHKDEVEIPTAGDYVRCMEENFVIVDQDKRRDIIRKQIVELGQKEGGSTDIDEDLLEEVVYLVEYPTALCGHFEDKYLSLPKECVVTPMREHQRYFPVVTADGKLLPKFITVRNGDANYLDVVAHGNERVLRARLSDAEFFFNEDRKYTLTERREKLKTVSFQEGLGNLYDKSERLERITAYLRKELNVDVDEEKLARTAQLCKADLVTGMVTEFTELQGVMGREYAKLDGESAEVALGIFEHYLPRFAGDELPATSIGRLTAIADKLDNIVATFSRGMAPTGSQDPFALRRQAIGVINTLVAAEYHLPLNKTLYECCLALDLDGAKIAEICPQIMDFFLQRARIILTEEKGVRYDVVDAALADAKNDDIYDIFLRADVLAGFIVSAGAADTIQAFTRVENICKKQEAEQTPIIPRLLKEKVEEDLYKAVCSLDKEVMAALARCDYKEILNLSGRLTAPVNAFFDGVMVMDKDEEVKRNRLALLELVRDIAGMVGDLSCIVM